MPSQKVTKRRAPGRRSSNVNKSVDEAKRTKVSITHLPQQVRTKIAGRILTFGQNDTGQLGLGAGVPEKGRPTLVENIENIAQVCCGGMHTVLLNKDGVVYTFGCLDDGILGREANDETSYVPGEVELPGPAVQITAGDAHSAALLEDGKVYVWGMFRDNSGNLGLLQPFKAEDKPVELNIDKTIVKIASGDNHLVLLTREGHVYTAGCAEQGQLGRISSRFSTRESRQGVLHWLLPGLVSFHHRIKYEMVDIWASSMCTFVKEKSRGIFVFGLNNYGQLGIPKQETTQAFYQPKIAASFNLANDCKKICGGEHHTLVLDNDGKVFALGRFEYGRLGLGEDRTEDANELTIIDTLNEKKCIDIACGSSVSFAITDEGECYGWGTGDIKQLGQGEDEDNKFIPTIIKGKQLEKKRCVGIDAGGQHTALLVLPALTNGSL